MSRRTGSVRLLGLAYLALGVALLLVVLGQVDLGEVASQVAAVGVAGLAAVLALYLVAFLIDAFTWQMALLEVPLSPRWLYRCFRVRMVGEVFNAVLPAGGMGGEPLKAVLLKRDHGIGYRAVVASLILSRTVNLIAQIAFLAVGFVVIVTLDLPAGLELVAGLGLLALGLATLLLFAVQRLRWSSRAGLRVAARLGARARAVFDRVADMERRLLDFYAGHPRRFLLALMLALLNWVIGALEVWVTLYLMGVTVGLAEAWVIEALAQLMRTGAFFVPAAIGVQEGVLVLVCGAVTGVPAHGLSVAVVRRARELAWLLWGTLLGLLATLRARRRQVQGASAGDDGTNH